MMDRLSPDQVLRAVLSNVETWADELRAAPAAPQPWGAVRHTIANMDQCAAILRAALKEPPKN
jgi:hypothetical protein